MEGLLIFRAVSVFLCATTIDYTSSQGTNNHHETPATIDATQNAHYFFYQRSEYPKDCRDAQKQCPTPNSSGVYIIKPDGFQGPFQVFCNNEVDTGGWTVIQRRENGQSVNFNRSWSEYKDGFGFLSTEFWLGNEKLSFLTNQALYELRVDMTLSNGSSFYTLYNGFRITDEYGQYTFTHIGEPESNAGSLISVCPKNTIYEQCSCQATCENPNEESGCKSDCSGEGCICPDGFLMHGSDCIRESECGCFLTEANMVIRNGEAYVNDNCTHNCLCNNNELNCTDYICGSNAVCGVKNGVRQCSCNPYYRGDGQACESLYSADCNDVYDAGHTEDGEYTILPYGWKGSPFNVSCKMDHDGGWTVFQRRTDDTTDFYQNWTAYKEGFGDHINFWLGNKKLYYLTNQKNYKLRLDITTSNGQHLNAEYTEFQIESESTNYTMNKLGIWSTSSGGEAGYSLSHNKGRQFSTYDRDNDACDYFNCAEKHRSGWWHVNYSSGCSSCYSRSNHCQFFQYNPSNCYSVCTGENLNGDYNGGNAENIYSYDQTHCNIISVEMKIRPSS